MSTITENLKQTVKEAIDEYFPKDFIASIKDYVEGKTKEPENEILNTEEVAALTGLSIHTIRTYASKELIPFYKPEGSNRLQFYKTVIKQWMIDRKVPNSNK